MNVLTIERYTHGIRLSGYTRETYYRIEGFLKKLELKEIKKLPHGRITMEVKKKYYGVFSDLSEIYMHVRSLEDLLDYMEGKGIPKSTVKIKDITVPIGKDAVFKIYDKFILRDYQEIIYKDILRPEIHSARVDLYTGYGKTISSLFAARTIGKRLLVMLPPKYFGLWIEALENTYQDIAMRYITVSGSGELKKLIDLAITDELNDVDVIMISSMTYRAYIDAFEEHGAELENNGYGIVPIRFHELLGIGCQINDEIQEDPGLLFRIDMYTNVAKQIYLSATPFTGNDYVTKMIDVMLPYETQCRLPEYKAYINCIGILYNEISIKPQDYLTPYKGTYNHTRYEKVMMDHRKRHKAYIAMLKRLIDGLYIKDRLPGQKLLILCATVVFIKDLTEVLKETYPDLKITDYVSGSKYEDLLESDITISTIKSAGTAVDIPNLREVLLCQATDSKKDNIQILGRLRPLKSFPGVNPRLTYLVCENIPQHLRYARNKSGHFEGRTLTMVMRRIAM